MQNQDPITGLPVLSENMPVFSGSKRTSGKDLVSSATKRKPLASIGNTAVVAKEPQLHHKNVGPFCLGDSIWSTTVTQSTQFRLPQSKPDLNSSFLLSSPESFIDPVGQGGSFLESIEPVCPYAVEVFEHLKHTEIMYSASSSYMAKQPDITYPMRAVLIDWLSEVCEEYRLQLSTLFLATSFVDRFLSKMAVSRSKLQLLGTSCLYLASKMEEIYPPNISEFVYITDNSYTRKQVVEMERLVLRILNWHLVTPNVTNFLTRYLSVMSCEEKCGKLAWYLCELAQMDGEVFLRYLPSELATSALCLALHTLQRQSWPNMLEHYSGYPREDLEHCIRDLHKVFVNSPHTPQQSIREKFSSEKYYQVGRLHAPPDVPM